MNSGDKDSKIQSSFKALPTSERPRERLLTQGAESLSNAELIAVLLRTGTPSENVLQVAEQVLMTCGGLAGLMRVTQHDLLKINGLGPTKATQIMAVAELAKRAMTLPNIERTAIDKAEDAARLLMDMQFLQQEHIRILLLDSARCLIASPTIYIGTLNTSILRVSEIYREAITRNSPAIILAHNHPSGDPTPSPEDLEITHTLIAAGKLLDIQLIDHLIMGHNQWVSLKALGLAFDA
ncbi:MAG: DNA repair protein RadC [Anaerolineaceae bacterium]|nr:DNA repair protein RadC [Anaerolineaceae bacterium]